MNSARHTLSISVLSTRGRLALALLVAVVAAIGALWSAPGAAADDGRLEVVSGVYAINGLLASGVTISAPVGVLDNTISISDQSKLAVGMIVQADSEIMRVNGLTEGTPDTMLVARGWLSTTITTHASGVALLSNNIPVKINGSGIGPLATGSTLQTALDTAEYEATTSTLSTTINGSATTINVSSINPFFVGRKAQMDNEKMGINGVTPGYMGLSGATTLEPVTAAMLTIKISDKTKLVVGSTIEIESEDMTVTALAGDGAGGVQDTMTVTRLVPVDHLSSGLDIYAQTGATTVQPIDAVMTTIQISDKTLLQVGWVIRVETEVMTITALSGDGPGGATDTMTVTRTSPVAHSSPVLFIYNRTGATTSEPAWAVMRTIKISDKTLLQVGWVVRIDVEAFNPEPMTITALSGDGPGGADDFMTVTRTAPVDHSTSPLNIWGGQDKMTVTRAIDGTVAASHNAGIAIWENIRTLNVTSHNGLKAAITIQIDSEKMNVRSVTAGYTLDSGTTLTADAGVGDTSISVSNAGLLQVGWVIRVDAEKMLITGLAGGAPGTATVTRAQEGTAAASHLAGTTIYGGQDKISVDRGVLSTSIASHGAGAAINDVDGLGSYLFDLSVNPTYLAPVSGADGGFLTSTGRPLLSCPFTLGASTLSVDCQTSGGLPLGPTGTGTLATATVYALVMTAPAATTVDLVDGQMLDANGDRLSSTVADGTVMVVKCADEDGNRVISLADAVLVIKAVNHLIPGGVKYDVDNNGALTLADAVDTIKLSNLGTRCPPGSV